MEKVAKVEMLRSLEKEEVKLLPWIGEKYDEGLFFNESGIIEYNIENHKKVLVITSAFYGDPEEDYDKNMTSLIIEDVIDQKQCWRTFIQFENTVLGREHTENDRNDFWNHVAFYSYKQSLDRDIVRPSVLCQDERSKVCFEKVLAQLSPDLIIFWGNLFFDILKKYPFEADNLYLDNFISQIYTYKINNKFIKGLIICHPASRGFLISETRDIIFSAMKS